MVDEAVAQPPGRSGPSRAGRDLRSPDATVVPRRKHQTEPVTAPRPGSKEKENTQEHICTEPGRVTGGGTCIPYPPSCHPAVPVRCGRSPVLASPPPRAVVVAGTHLRTTRVVGADHPGRP